MDKTFRSTARFFVPVGGDIMWWMIISVSVILNYLNICGFNNKIDSALAQLIYVLISFPICFFCVFLSKLFGIDKYLGTGPNITMVDVASYEGYIIWHDDPSSIISAGTALFPVISPLHDNSADLKEEKNWFAHVVFENKKRKYSFNTKTAEEVTAHLNFFSGNDPKKNLLNYDFIGRWGNYMPQPGDKLTVLGTPEFTFINMKAEDGKKYSLDIAIKNTQASFMTAFNNLNYRGRNLMYAENTFAEKTIIVEVILTANNIYDLLKYYFELSHNGVGDGLHIKQIDNPFSAV